MRDPVSNVSERLPKSAEETDLLKTAISDLLTRIPDTWAEFEHDQLTHVQSGALFLLTAAGMVERRGWMRSSIANHPTCFEIRFQATGEGRFVKAMEAVHAAEYAVWADAWRQWKAGETGHVSPFQIEAMKPQEWRLTNEGISARGNLDGTNPNPRPNDVFDYVLKRGFWGPGYWLRIADVNPQRLRDEAGSIAEHARVTGQHWTELPRPPVSGDGLIVTIRKIEQPAGPQAVNVANWQAGGDAFAQAFGPLLEQMLQRMSETGHGTQASTTEAADATDPNELEQCGTEPPAKILDLLTGDQQTLLRHLWNGDNVPLDKLRRTVWKRRPVSDQAIKQAGYRLGEAISRHRMAVKVNKAGLRLDKGPPTTTE